MNRSTKSDEGIFFSLRLRGGFSVKIVFFLMLSFLPPLWRIRWGDVMSNQTKSRKETAQRRHNNTIRQKMKRIKIGIFIKIHFPFSAHEEKLHPRRAQRGAMSSKGSSSAMLLLRS